MISFAFAHVCNVSQEKYSRLIEKRGWGVGKIAIEKEVIRGWFGIVLKVIRGDSGWFEWFSGDSGKFDQKCGIQNCGFGIYSGDSSDPDPLYYKTK